MIDQLAGLSDLARVLPRTHGQRRSLRRAAHGAAFCIMFHASAAIRPQSAVSFVRLSYQLFTWQLAPRGNGGLLAPAAPGWLWRSPLSPFFAPLLSRPPLPTPLLLRSPGIL
jgi:hypothetical protein